MFREVAHRAVSSVRETMQATLVRRGADERQILINLVERMYLGATEPKTLALMRLVIAEAMRFPELAKSLYAESSYVLAPVIDYLAEAHRTGKLRVPNAELAAVQLSRWPSAACASSSRSRSRGPRSAVPGRSIVDLVMRGWAPIHSAMRAPRPKQAATMPARSRAMRGTARRVG